MDSPPVILMGSEFANPDYHDGQLRQVVGVQSYQVLRANRSRPELAEGYGWTYNHAPMLAHWRGRFHLEYLSSPVHEWAAPSQALLTSSSDGRDWQTPAVIFPPYPTAEDGLCVAPPGNPHAGRRIATNVHHRMGFYVSADDRLLALSFYGLCDQDAGIGPNDGSGIGRVVREIYAPDSWGPIYFLRYNRHAGWNEANTCFPFYASCPDEGFRRACDELLANRLATLQWWEEDRSPDGFYAAPGYKALSYYHLPDGQVVGLWKWSKVAISADEGLTWSEVTDSPSLVMAGGKIWGQRIAPDAYAICYNPSYSDWHRWPLAVATSTDGLRFRDLRTANGQVPPRRYAGQYKSFGLNYIRGIEEGTGQPATDAFWVTYSMNKEDIWVSRIPVPIMDAVSEPVSAVFDPSVAEPLAGWTIYSPLWAPVRAVDFPATSDGSLELRDRDPYDYAAAERAFPPSLRVTIRFRLYVRQPGGEGLHLDVCDGRGARPVRLCLQPDGRLTAQVVCWQVEVGHCGVGAWHTVELMLDAQKGYYDLVLDGKRLQHGARFVAPVRAVERFVVRTGPYRSWPDLDTDAHIVADLPGADEPVTEACYLLNGFTTRDHLLSATPP